MTRRKRFLLQGLPLALCLGATMTGQAGTNEFPKPETHYDLKLLGKYIFFDKISQVNTTSGATPQRMGCVTCHDPDAGGTYFVSGVNKHQVGVTSANPHNGIGGRKPPTNAYASFAEPFDPNCPGGPGPCGGNFWDGRAVGAFNPVYTNESGEPTTTEHIDVEILADLLVNPEIDPGLKQQVAEYSAYFGPITDQALNPMPNPVEQNIDEQTVCEVVAASQYAPLYEKAFGVPIDCSDDAYALSFRRMMLSVGAYQHSSDINSFSSPRDIALQAELDCKSLQDNGAELPQQCDDLIAAKATLTDCRGNAAVLGKFPLAMLPPEANFGHDLFYGLCNEVLPGPPGAPPRGEDLDNNGLLRNVNCAFCHSSGGPGNDGTNPQELYTENRFHALGLPANPELPSDPGLSGVTGDQLTFLPFPPRPGSEPAPVDPGWFRNMTVRNVDKRPGEGFTKAYMHNGVFKSLESVMHFYNTGNVNGATAAAYGVTRCVDEEGAPILLMSEKEMLANNCWAAPEFPVTGTTLPAALGALIGNMGLSLEEEAAIIAYMKTLSDTHTAKAPHPYNAD